MVSISFEFKHEDGSFEEDGFSIKREDYLNDEWKNVMKTLVGNKVSGRILAKLKKSKIDTRSMRGKKFKISKGKIVEQKDTV